MYKIAIIGGSGFIGTKLTELIKDSQDVKIIDKNNSVLYPEITSIADIRDKNSIISSLNNQQCVVLLAAEHRDDVYPHNLYYDVNVNGTKNVLDAMDFNGIKNIIFTSSVAIYGLNKNNPDENSLPDPFNHYGISKWQAEEILREWYFKNPKERSLTIIRPTVIFGERNRGNVYNLLKQIASGHFIMIGKGRNYKSMAYIGNIAAFLKFQIENLKPGYKIFNYSDKPDLNMNELVKQVEASLNKRIPSIHLPFWIGLLGGYFFDQLSRITNKKYAISSVRVRKFCATTQFNSSKIQDSEFSAPYTLCEGLHKTIQTEFLNKKY